MFYCVYTKYLLVIKKQGTTGWKAEETNFLAHKTQYELASWESDIAVLQNRVDLASSFEYEIRKNVLGQCKGLSSPLAVCLQWWAQQLLSEKLAFEEIKYFLQCSPSPSLCSSRDLLNCFLPVYLLTPKGFLLLTGAIQLDCVVL